LETIDSVCFAWHSAAVRRRHVSLSVFEEYGVTPAEVERAHKKVLAEIKHERRAGTLKPWRLHPAILALCPN
jgi:hypothetical protein